VLRGRIDCAERGRVFGWAQDTEHPGAPVSLLITVEGVMVARVLCNRFRPDLLAAGFGTGRHAFEVEFLHPLSSLVRHIVHVQREGDGAHCPGSPVVLEPATSFDAATQRHVSALLAAAESDEELLQRLEFLAGEADRLLQRRADGRARRHERGAHRQFRSRWTASPAESEGHGPPPRRALVIDEAMPDPGRDAGSNAVLSHMASLCRLGAQVVFAPANMEAAGSAALDGLGAECCGRPWYATVEEVLQREAGGFDLVYLHRESIATRYAALVRQHLPNARLVLSMADLQHLRLARQAQVEDRPELVAYSRQVRAREMLAAWSADAVITHSTYEAQLLGRELPSERIHILPWSVPPRPTVASFAARRGVGFIGHYGHSPNAAAARWLVEAVMPLVWELDPEIECVLAGSSMPEHIWRLANPRVVPLGQVADLASVFGRVRLTVAPLLYGAGVKGKVWDSLAAGVPCACTPVAAEGMDLPESLQRLITPDAQGLAALIHRLHCDEALHRECRTVGLAYVAQHLSEERIDGLMQGVIGRSWK